MPLWYARFFLGLTKRRRQGLFICLDVSTGLKPPVELPMPHQQDGCDLWIEYNCAHRDVPRSVLQPAKRAWCRLKQGKRPRFEGEISGSIRGVLRHKLGESLTHCRARSYHGVEILLPTRPESVLALTKFKEKENR